MMPHRHQCKEQCEGNVRATQGALPDGGTEAAPDGSHQSALQGNALPMKPAGLLPVSLLGLKGEGCANRRAAIWCRFHPWRAFLSGCDKRNRQ